MEAEEALEKLDAAARRFRRTKKAHEGARQAAAEAVLEALKAGARPTDVAARAPFTDSYMRRIVREDKERRERGERGE